MEIIDKNVMTFFESLNKELMNDVGFAQALCAIFMLIYFAIKIYPMMAGDQRLEIMPLLRPFGIALVIIFWPQFISLIKSPADAATTIAKEEFYSKSNEIADLTKQRYELQDSIARSVYENASTVEHNFWLSIISPAAAVGVEMVNVIKQLCAMQAVVVAKTRYLLARFLEWIVFTIFQGAAYLVFALQIVVISILVIIGPISFAFSVLPAWWTAWSQWVARFVSVSLWSTIAYLILMTVFKFIIYALKSEIQGLQVLSQLPEGEFLAATSSPVGLFEPNMYMIALIIGIICLCGVFPISTWIVPTSGAAQAVQAPMASIGAAATVTKVV